MKERPILFSAHMVRALLAGQKTQTRRIVKSQPRDHWRPDVGGFHPTIIDRHGDEQPGAEVYGASDTEEGRVCPYGRPGDGLWVKETWKTVAGIDHLKPSLIAPGAAIAYAAGGTRLSGNAVLETPGKTRVSIFMPRWASRISLKIVRIRVERLQDINEADAEAEGVDFMRHIPDADETLTAIELYEILWEAINGAGSWAENPWVWVVEFKRMES